MPIRRLSEDMVNRIAAGEVVERPASVVKELVENAIDAGARRIEVVTAAGGVALIRVTDDGGGIGARRPRARGRAPLHVEARRRRGGLDDIRSLGFRGEALAAIGAAARLTVASRQAGSGRGVGDRRRRRRDSAGQAGGAFQAARGSRCATSSSRRRRGSSS